MERKKLGLIINPVAGLGGSVGLKGSDGMVEEALARGAVPQSECRARVALQELLHDRDHLIVYTGTGNMGAALSPLKKMLYREVPRISRQIQVFRRYMGCSRRNRCIPR